ISLKPVVVGVVVVIGGEVVRRNGELYSLTARARLQNIGLGEVHKLHVRFFYTVLLVRQGDVQFNRVLAGIAASIGDRDRDSYTAFGAFKAARKGHRLIESCI